MGHYIVKLTDKAKRHLSHIWKSGNTRDKKRIERIIFELSQTPYKGIGKPEALKYELNGVGQDV